MGVAANEEDVVPAFLELRVYWEGWRERSTGQTQTLYTQFVTAGLRQGHGGHFRSVVREGLSEKLAFKRQFPRRTVS